MIRYTPTILSIELEETGTLVRGGTEITVSGLMRSHYTQRDYKYLIAFPRQHYGARS
jgi:hypothetical protein